MGTRLFTAELQQERKAIVKAFPTQVAAAAWASERVQDESIGAVCIWRMASTGSAAQALLAAAEGKPWHDERTLVRVVVRKGARRSAK